MKACPPSLKLRRATCFAGRPRQSSEAHWCEAGWRWAQSPANYSPRSIPCYPGKLQGIFAIWGLSATMDRRKDVYSLAFLIEFPTQPNRENFLRNRELIRGNREFSIRHQRKRSGKTHLARAETIAICSPLRFRMERRSGWLSMLCLGRDTGSRSGGRITRRGSVAI